MTASPDTLEWSLHGGDQGDLLTPRPAPTGTVRTSSPVETRTPKSFPTNAYRCQQAREQRPQCQLERRHHARAVVRRRRILLGVVAVALLTALALPWGGTGGRSLAPPGSALAGTTLHAHQQYVVEPGDTLWSIASRFDPSGDPRPVVSELAEQVGSNVVVPGERLRLP